MCQICTTLRPNDPDCIYQNAAPAAALVENRDASESIFTAYSMNVGDSFSGSIGFFGDRDWIAIELESGKTYDISLNGVSLSDTYLRVYNSDGVEQAFDDDGGDGLNSYIPLEVFTGGTFYISAEEFGDDATGTYTVTVTGEGGGGLPEFTPDEIADQLTDGFWRGNGGPRRFDVSNGDTLSVNLSALTADGKALARMALESWTNVTGIRFSEVTGRSDISFDDNQDGAFANSSVNGSDFITNSHVNIGTDWLRIYGTTIDSYSFQTYIHEIGHALGLGHAGNYNGAAEFGVDNHYLNDSWQATVMSYFNQDDNTFIDAGYALVMTPMIADIIAIQNLYGSDTGVYAGNTVFGVNSNVGGYLERLFGQLFGTDPADPGFYSGEPVTITVYDTGGTDTINLSLDTSNQRVDLRDGAISDVGSVVGSMSIARGTIIENFIAGSGDDAVTGNAAANNLRGGAGKDRLIGESGNDRLLGEDGNDQLTGSVGGDTMSGGAGKDKFVYLRATDSAVSSNDRITDFRSRTDKFDFRQTDANSEDRGRQDWIFIGTDDFSERAGELHVVRNSGSGLTFVGGDLDGDGDSDFVIELQGLINLVRNDFIL